MAIRAASDQQGKGSQIMAALEASGIDVLQENHELIGVKGWRDGTPNEKNLCKHIAEYWSSPKGYLAPPYNRIVANTIDASLQMVLFSLNSEPFFSSFVASLPRKVLL